MPFWSSKNSKEIKAVVSVKGFAGCRFGRLQVRLLPISYGYKSVGKYNHQELKMILA